MAKEVSFLIKIQDNGGAKRVTADAEEMGRAIREVQDEAEKARWNMLSWAEAAQAAEVVQNAISGLREEMSKLVEDYQASVTAQTKLETIMRGRMGASEDEINSIRELCSRQQELGVVEDDIAASGAQQMATFLKQKSSLEMLIPAMNNLIAQQMGYKATAEGAVSIGNMMGKAMQGQTEVLQRVGITFTEAQKNVLQYGDESARAAMLAEVITENVGEMNKALGQTDVGHLKQLENKLGDIKEAIGKVVQAAMPYTELAFAVSQIVFMLMKSVTAVKSVAAAFAGLNLALNINKLNTRAAKDMIRVLCTTLGVTTLSASSARIALRGVTWALRGLEAATVIGAVLAGLSIVMEKLGMTSENTSDKVEGLGQSARRSVEAMKSAEESYRQQNAQVFSELMSSYRRLQAEWKQLDKSSRSGWVKTHREEMARLGLTVNSVADAENVFSKQTDMVVEGFKRRAQAAAYAAKLQSLYSQQMIVSDRLAELNAEAAARHKVSAGEEVLSSHHDATTGNETLGSDGKWRYTEQGARAANSVKWIANNSEAQDLRQTQRELQRAIDETAASLGKLSEENNAGIKLSNTGTASGSVSKPSKRENKSSRAVAEEERTPVLRPMELMKRDEEPKLKGSISSIGDMMQAQVDRINGMRAKATWIEQLKDAGVLSAEAASQAIGEINDQLDALGAKKVDIDIDSNSAEKARKRLENATDAIGQMGSSLSSMGDAMEMPILNVAGTLAQAIATMALGYAQATSKSAALGPWGWIAFAATGLAQLAAMVSAVKGMSKFADGGIAYGPTIGLFGEYAGASHNPEVVAPLDKLRGMLPQGAGGQWNGGEVVFRIKGRNLEGVLKKRERRMSRL